jgi:acyl-CoA reductase-like NAD-dependent aldehyde dehydrogenase
MSASVKLISPIDGSIYAERPYTTDATLDAAIAKARAAQAEWALVPVAERVKLVLGFLEAVLAMNDEIVPELAWQMGRPVRFGGEKGGLEERCRYMASIAAESLQSFVPEEKAGFRRYIKHEPLGLVLVVAPWNYPFLTAINTIVPALIAGNAVVLKHASQTILAGERLAQAFANLPEGVFANLVLTHDTTSELIGARAFDFINFTGSVAGGRSIERAAAGTFVGTGLELGGKDPGYVRADAKLETAVDVLMDGAMYNAGQCCCGIERIYVHESLYAPFVEKAVDWVSKLTLGSPLEEATTLGPMAHRRFADTVRAQTAEALAAGAKGLVDAGLFPADAGDTAYLAPQILVDVDHSMRVMTEESFGPVVGIMPVRDDAEAIALMNDCRYGLTASVWTQDLGAAEAIGAELESGTVFMNRADYLDPALCWTGVKETGRGASLSHLGFLAVTRPKSYHFRKL